MRTLALLTCLVATTAAALAQEQASPSRNNNQQETAMKQDETIRSQKERQPRGPEYDRLEVLIGKGITVGKTEPMGHEPPLHITASDIYQWLPGKYWVVSQVETQDWEADLWLLITPAMRRADSVQPHLRATPAQAILKNIGGRFAAWQNLSTD
ncbi:MAG TPA: hypothetical protein VEU96_27025 [Bryobacteraceae bacterium]|nr:hypothetical protein [Bryobacteraceae bacterium]